MNVQEQIKNIVEENSVMLFMKGSPDFPQCGFSGRLVQILQACGAQFASADVLSDDKFARESRIFRTGRPSRNSMSTENLSAAVTS